MIYLLGLLVTFILADGLITHVLVGNGFKEGNPLLVPLVAQGNLMVLKLAGTVVCVIILWDLYKRSPKLAIISTSFFVAVYGLVVLWNLGLLLSPAFLFPACLASFPIGWHLGQK